MKLEDVKQAVEKKYGITLNQQRSKFALTKQYSDSSQYWCIRKGQTIFTKNNIYAAYQRFIHKTNMTLYSTIEIKNESDLQEFFDRTQDVDDLVRAHFKTVR